MAIRETTLQMIRRLIRDGRGHVDEQQVIIDRLRSRGHPTKLAEDLLLVFQDVQKQREAHLDGILKQRRF